MDENFIPDRITEYRIKTNISEYQMSLDLGHSQGYIHSISSGRNLPSLRVLFDICNYFKITPAEFFDTDIKNPELLREFIEIAKTLNEDDLKSLMYLMKNLHK
ncbi:MAG: helix-turn-helix transcriptional regulator [Lachnospiraceae bacterium]|nr:helix-turn-helix transcriptional regulator [Lachnospiraceae bacterium]